MNQLTILVVDDDRIQRVYMEQLLRYSRSLNVHLAASVNEAKSIMAEYPVDAAILDLVLEQGSGLEVAGLFKAKGLPVAFCTASHDDHNLSLMYEFGLVIKKPATLPAVCRVLEYFDNAKIAREMRNG